ncbi:MAG: mandelate racemase [Acidimicrobiaceae bacterium]|nr:mandelate racemase [Acidimicrobiaceae bacterium]
MIGTSVDPVIETVATSVYRIPTDRPEADGTFAWQATTMVIVEVGAGGQTGIGYTYGAGATAALVEEALRPVLVNRSALAPAAAFEAMVRALRNIGRPGVGSMATAACDAALWDLAGRLQGQPVVRLLGAWRESVAVYGSGGFTTYDEKELVEQLVGWAEQGISAVKMKIGTDWGSAEEADLARVRAVRRALDDHVALFVDANGAYQEKQALRLASRFEQLGVTWFEEPVSSDDLAGLARIRAQTVLDVAAGEYGYDLSYFGRMAPSVDCLQADVTRCGGITEWLRIAALAKGLGLDCSGHCAPALHLHAACAVQNARHLEYFHDHTRIEELLFDGAARPRSGRLWPDLTRPGLGIELKRRDAEAYRIA